MMTLNVLFCCDRALEHILLSSMFFHDGLYSIVDGFDVLFL